MTYALPVLADPQRYELLSLDVWRRKLGDPDAQRFGRNGQSQYGVDIFGRDAVHGGLRVGIQCKLPIQSTITMKALDDEVAKAAGFSPRLDAYWLAYAGARDGALQRRAADITSEHERSGGFTVHVYSWNDFLEDVTSWPSLIEIYWPDHAGHRTVRLQRVSSGALRAEIDLTAEADAAVANVFDEMEIRAFFDERMRADVRSLAAEIALNAFEHGKSRRLWITFHHDSIDLLADGPPFNPLAANSISDGVGLQFVAHFREQYSDRVRLGWNRPSLRIYALSSTSFKSTSCVALTNSAAMSRLAAIDLAGNLSLPPHCEFYTVIIPLTITLSADRAFVDEVMRRAGGKPVIFRGSPHDIRSSIVARWGDRAVFIPLD
ncbi:hypothetical protein [Nucisporomicrobium flavum]|uniref:hypothetical protein n=1 Tax=Nucisporomicrobium flavum TaxID=2785915 RepID=UPI0018F3F5A0|nr:hypothetical protein [Nucisporomicrobium flavum]